MEKITEQIRAELKRLINEKHKSCTTEKEKNKAVNEARAEINKKYGKDWREKTPSKSKGKYDYPSIYDGHTNGEFWMD